MALQPFVGTPGALAPRACSQPPGHRAATSAMMPFGAHDDLFPFGVPFGRHGLLGGGDPFAEFGMMGPFGGGGIGAMFQQLEEMSMGGGGFPGEGGMMVMGGSMASGSMMMSGGMLGGGDGQYTTQTFMMSSNLGADGQVHTENFSSSEVGNRNQGIREAQQAYSNSSSGMDKMAMERQLGDRGIKVVRETDRNSMEERSTELLRGLEEDGREAFGRDFDARAHYLPQHQKIRPQVLAQGGAYDQGPYRSSPQALTYGSAYDDGHYRAGSIIHSVPRPSTVSGHGVVQALPPTSYAGPMVPGRVVTSSVAGYPHGCTSSNLQAATYSGAGVAQGPTSLNPLRPQAFTYSGSSEQAGGVRAPAAAALSYSSLGAQGASLPARYNLPPPTRASPSASAGLGVAPALGQPCAPGAARHLPYRTVAGPPTFSGALRFA